MPRQQKKNHKSMKVEDISLCKGCRTQIKLNQDYCVPCEKKRERNKLRRAIKDDAYKVQLVRHKGLS